jgi:folate-binding protein YgfZ
VTIRTTARVPWGVVLHFEGSPGASIDALEAAAPELCLLGPIAQEVLRIESGVPRAGRELTGDEFPQEARLEEAVSFEKGCYLGQETVARIHYRGHVNRLLCRLELDGEVETPVALELDGREVGSVTSASAAARAALGYVRREHAEPGNRLGIAGQERAFATVREFSAG